MKQGLRFFTIPRSLEEKIFLYMASAIAFSIPFKPSFNSALSITLLVFWLLFMEKKFERQRIRILILISTLFWIALVGMLTTQNSEEGWFRIQQKSLLIIFPLVFGTIAINWQNQLKWIVSFFMAGVILACLICLCGAIKYWILFNDTQRFFEHGLVESVVFYPYIMALLCLMSILVITEAYMGNLKLHAWLHNRTTIFSLIFSLSVFILLLSVKQIIILWIIFFIFYSVRIPKSRTIVVLILLLCLLTVLSIFYLPRLREKIDEITDFKENSIPLDEDSSLGRNWNGVAVRKAIWICAFDVIQNNLFFGVGTGDGHDALQASYEKRQFYFASRYNRYNAHNQFIQVLVTFGIIGFSLWLGSLFLLFIKLKSNRLVVGLLGCLMFAMITESMLETNKGSLLMAFPITVFAFAALNKNRLIVE